MGQIFALEPPAAPANGSAAEMSLVNAYLPELDEMRAAVCRYVEMDPAEILSSISGISGRLAEMRAQLQRRNSQACIALRTREVDPLREELDLQFKVWSRKIALMEWELRMSGGGI